MIRKLFKESVILLTGTNMNLRSAEIKLKILQYKYRNSEEYKNLRIKEYGEEQKDAWSKPYKVYGIIADYFGN
jgi:hypothetical protein